MSRRAWGSALVTIGCVWAIALTGAGLFLGWFA